MLNDNKNDSISIIYNQRNDSPRYFELSKKKLLSFAIGLPTVTILSIIIGTVGLVHISPFHLIESYRQASKARDAIAQKNSLLTKIQKISDDNYELTLKLKAAEEQLAKSQTTTNSTATSTTLSTPNTQQSNQTLGVSSLAFFKPVTGQKDRTKPATVNLSGFIAKTNRDNIELSFNIIPAISGDNKLAGYIIVSMKNELGIQIYPSAALNGLDHQIAYTSGEPFATQRFRPVMASFLKPRKSGNYIFSVFIFARNGDLVHNQSVVLPIKI